MAGRLGRVAVVGAGAVGAYYGARLARTGEDVTFLLRSDLAAVREAGLSVRVVSEPQEAFEIRPAQVAADTRAIGPVDLVLLGMKATGNEALAELLPPLLRERTAILNLQNGLGADEWLADRFGGERILGGLCFVCLNRVGPGRIECYHPGSVALGEYGRVAGERAHAIGQALRDSGVACLVADNLQEMRWRKLVWNVPFNGLSIAAGGITTDRILADTGLRAEVDVLMREVQSAARAFGFVIPDSFLARQLEVTYPMGPYKPSSLVDYLAGRAVEVEAIWGEPLRRARTAGVDTPGLAALYERLVALCPRVG
ncbi:putative 2-dehydropantoate 2-reductase [Opitutales bacterium ASA1]|uniref:2-dehydropantoate 2-reductase n=1 Tax=Congregicoccus parvus TaxID=3081749 RepID=UPI002B2BF71C|nr:putative 2-dehydropantoate 2-reductase [Opitutales bacterium ASA1]